MTDKALLPRKPRQRPAEGWIVLNYVVSLCFWLCLFVIYLGICHLLSHPELLEDPACRTQCAQTTGEANASNNTHTLDGGNNTTASQPQPPPPSSILMNALMSPPPKTNETNVTDGASNGTAHCTEYGADCEGRCVRKVPLWYVLFLVCVFAGLLFATLGVELVRWQIYPTSILFEF